MELKTGSFSGVSIIHIKGGKAALVVDYMDTEVLKKSWARLRTVKIKIRTSPTLFKRLCSPTVYPNSLHHLGRIRIFSL
jgi:hypothetical protein